MWTTFRGDPEYSGLKEQKRTFPFEFQPKFQESGMMESTLSGPANAHGIVYQFK